MPIWIFVFVAIFILMAAYVTVSQPDRMASSVAEQVKQDVVAGRNSDFV